MEPGPMEPGPMEPVLRAGLNGSDLDRDRGQGRCARLDPPGYTVRVCPTSPATTVASSCGRVGFAVLGKGVLPTMFGPRARLCQTATVVDLAPHWLMS